MEEEVVNSMESVLSAISTALSTIATNVGTAFSTIVPIALGIMGTAFVVRLAIRHFKGLSK